MGVSLREPLKPALSEPASNVHAPLAVSDACLAISLLPFTPQLRHPGPPALPRSAASASYGQPGGCQRPRRLAPWARRGSFGAGRGRRSGAAGDLLRELAVWTRLAEVLGAVVAGAPPCRGGWELSLRDVPARSCFAAVAQGPGGEQRQGQRRPGDDRGGGGCLRRSAGAGAAAPRWGTRLGYSGDCSQSRRCYWTCHCSWCSRPKSQPCCSDRGKVAVSGAQPAEPALRLERQRRGWTSS